MCVLWPCARLGPHPVATAGVAAADASCVVLRRRCLSFTPCSQDFLNGVCTHIIWLTQRKLTYYTGNYDTFEKTVAENEVRLPLG